MNRYKATYTGLMMNTLLAVKEVLTTILVLSAVTVIEVGYSYFVRCVFARRRQGQMGGEPFNGNFFGG